VASSNKPQDNPHPKIIIAHKDEFTGQKQSMEHAINQLKKDMY